MFDISKQVFMSSWPQNFTDSLASWEINLMYEPTNGSPGTPTTYQPHTCESDGDIGTRTDRDTQ